MVWFPCRGRNGMSLTTFITQLGAAGGVSPEYIYIYAYPNILKVSTVDASIAASVDFYNTPSIGDSNGLKSMTFGDDGKLYTCSAKHIHRFNPDTLVLEERSGTATTPGNTTSMNSLRSITYIDGYLYSCHNSGTSAAYEFKIQANNLAGGFTYVNSEVFDNRGYRHLIASNGSGKRCYGSQKYTYGMNGFDFTSGTDVVVSTTDIQGTISMHYYKGWWIGPWYTGRTHYVQDGSTSFSESFAIGGNNFGDYRMSNGGLLVMSDYNAVKSAQITQASGLSGSTTNNIIVSSGSPSYNPNNKNLVCALPSKNEYRVVFLIFESETIGGNVCVRIARCDLNTNTVTAIGYIDPVTDLGTALYLDTQPFRHTSTVTKAEMEWDAP